MDQLLPKLRQIIYSILSEQTIFRFLRIYSHLSMIFLSSKLKKIKKIYKNAPLTPQWLEWDDLVRLQNKYPRPFIKKKKKTGRKTNVLSIKGKNKAVKLIKLIKKEELKYKKFLELGCNEGMVCYYLDSMEKEAIGIDINDKYFDERALKKEVSLIKMDATDLKFEDETFDFVFSFDCFEHFPKPDKVLEEAIRVVRKGGYIYIVFSLPFPSPYGMHAIKSITVPYCQYLFPVDLMRRFSLTLKDFRPFPEDLSLNEWSTDEFRLLWKKHLDKLNIIEYNENFDLSQINLISQYPSCFKSKTTNFDNLIVSSIEILFKKR